MNSLLINVEDILSEIASEFHWKNAVNLKINEVEKSINNGIARWTRLMIILSSSELFADVDRISNEIINLKAYLKDLFPKVSPLSLSLSICL